MILSEIRDRCRLYVRDPDGTGRTQVEWDAMINDEYRSIMRDTPAEEIESTVVLVAGASEMPVPAAMKTSTLPMILRDGAPLRYRPIREMPVDADRTLGDPMRFSVRGRSIVFDATAASNLTLGVRFAKQTAALVADGDEPGFDPEFHDVLWEGPVAAALLADEDERGAAYHAARADRLRAQIRSAYARRHEAKRRQEE